MVAQFHSIRRFSALHTGLFAVLFYNKIGNNRICADTVVHWLHGLDGVDVLAFDGYYRVLCGLRFYQENLQCGENRLKQKAQRLFS